MNDEIQLEDFKVSIIALWRKKLLIICATILASLVGLLITFNEQAVNTYAAKTSIYNIGYGSAQETNYSSIALITYAKIITSINVCERAASLLEGNLALDAADIQRMIGVNELNDSVIEIYAISTNPEISIAVTNAVAETFVREVTSTTENDAIQILDAADSCTINTDGEKDILTKRLFFAIIGFVGSSAYIICTELLLNKIGSVVQCIDKDENEILGIIPYLK